MKLLFKGKLTFPLQGLIVDFKVCCYYYEAYIVKNMESKKIFMLIEYNQNVNWFI